MRLSNLVSARLLPARSGIIRGANSHGALNTTRKPRRETLNARTDGIDNASVISVWLRRRSFRSATTLIKSVAAAPAPCGVAEASQTIMK